MFAACLAFSFAISPRIVPLDPSQSIQILNRWQRDCTDANRLQTIQCMKQECSARGRVGNRGSIGLLRGTDCQAIAMFVNPPLTITHLYSNDDSSGTLIMKAIVKTTHIEFSDSLDDRWRVAAKWFR